MQALMCEHTLAHYVHMLTRAYTRIYMVYAKMVNAKQADNLDARVEKESTEITQRGKIREEAIVDTMQNRGDAYEQNPQKQKTECIFDQFLK